MQYGPCLKRLERKRTSGFTREQHFGAFHRKPPDTSPYFQLRPAVALQGVRWAAVFHIILLTGHAQGSNGGLPASQAECDGPFPQPAFGDPAAVISLYPSKDDAGTHFPKNYVSPSCS